MKTIYDTLLTIKDKWLLAGLVETYNKVHGRSINCQNIDYMPLLRAKTVLNKAMNDLKFKKDKTDQDNKRDIILKRIKKEIDKVLNKTNKDLMNYSDDIIKAYNNWMDKSAAELNEEEHSPNYKKIKAASKRAGDKFEKLCNQNYLNYITVADDLCNKTLKLTYYMGKEL